MIAFEMCLVTWFLVQRSFLRVALLFGWFLAVTGVRMWYREARKGPSRTS